jgi:tetratricopeptide (TPR) repeat protein
MSPARRCALIAVLTTASATAVAQERRPDSTRAAAHEHAGHAPSTGAPTLLPGLGDWRHPISTKAPSAQQFFDQGLRLAYAFSLDEAVRSFTEATRLDPSCAMCWWGVAYALSPNINLPMTAEAESKALVAIRNAQRLASGASESERAYIDAMARRVGEPAGADRAARDSAYATAMAAVARRWPDDVDAQVLHADAMLNLRPWNQWTPEGAPQPGTLEVVAILERAVKAAPNHAGACHFYVHTVEASLQPERALPCAERLPRLMPGAGHIVHMPAHVYLRVGRYADAARANIAAVEADRRYVSSSAKSGDFYPTFYPAHNEHFLWMTYVLSGQRAKAERSARALTQSVSVADAKANASLEAFLAVAPLTPLRFGDWARVLAEPAPPAELRYLRGMWHYARGMAHAARGDVSAASVELDSVRAIAASVPASMIIILNPAPAVLELAASVLAGQVALAQGRPDVAVTHLRDAVRRETALTYDEPPPWYHSTRHLLGLALLEAGDARGAEAAFRDDLRIYPENGWGLAGLERALRQQNREREANEVAARLRTAWRDADSPAIAPR